MNLVVDFFLIGGMVVTAIILLLLFKSSKNRLPQKLLILFFLMLFFYMVHTYASTHDLEILIGATFIFDSVLELFIGPLIYVYIKSLFENPKTLIRKNIIHFLPFLVFLFFAIIPIFISLLQDEFLFDYLAILNQNSLLIFTLFMMYLLLYLILSLRLFYKYRKVMQSNFSTLSETDFGWVRNMLFGTLIVGSIDIVLNNFRELIFETEVEYDFITLILIVILIIYLGYYGVNQTNVLLPDFLLQRKHDEKSTIENEVISQEDIVGLEQSKTQLLAVLEIEKPYLDEELTLSKLASYINISDKKLSYLLNQYMETNFYDFVNAYRIQSVKDKLASKDFEHLTLLGIAYESGFKSKTSFNRIFKKETGTSPSEYKKSLTNS